jgi:hypothetical protein
LEGAGDERGRPIVEPEQEEVPDVAVDRRDHERPAVRREDKCGGGDGELIGSGEIDPEPDDGRLDRDADRKTATGIRASIDEMLITWGLYPTTPRYTFPLQRHLS